MRQYITDKIPHCKTNTRQKTHLRVGSKVWNTIITKNHIEDCTSMIVFKKAMENIFTRNTAQLGYSGVFQYNSMY